MKTYKIEAKTGKIPAKATMRTRSELGTTDLLRKMVNGEVDYIQTSKFESVKDLRVAQARLHAVASTIGISKSIATHTTADMRLVAYPRKMKAVTA